ncbi:MAG TPA: single-stranded DNA-binding protein [Porphyromonadaceae bacterium]|nr:single-stranded DNA-binding protein [Porphyromonadaceae bacterium]
MAIISAVGNIGRDGELRQTSSGTAVLSFSVASKHGFGDKAITTWFECEVWGNFAEAISERVVKGSKVAFSGNFWIEQWEKDGKRGSKARVKILEIDIQNLSPRDSGQQEQGGGYGGGSDTGSDIPF